MVSAAKIRRINSTEAGVIDVEDDNENVPSRSARKKRRVSIQEYDSEMEAFGAQMKQAELARVVVEQKRLDFDRARFLKMNEEREKDRQECREHRKADRLECERERAEYIQERREDRDASNNLDLEKFKLMMETFVKNRN